MRRYEPNSENDILHPSPPHVIISFLYLFIFFSPFADLRTIATAKPTGRECFSFIFFSNWFDYLQDYSDRAVCFQFLFLSLFFLLHSPSSSSSSLCVCIALLVGKWKSLKKKKNTSANWELHDDDTTKNLKNNARGRIHNERFGLCVVEREGGILRRFQ